MSERDNTVGIQEYHFTRSYKGIVFFGILFFSVMFFLGFAAIFFEPRFRDMWWFHVVVGAYIPLIWYTLFAWWHRNDYVQVDSTAIRHFSRNEQRAILFWQDVSIIRERAIFRRLELLDVRGKKVIDLDYGFEDFNRLRQILYENTPHLYEERLLHKVFYRSARVYVLYVLVLIFSIAFGVIFLLMPHLFFALIFIVFSLLAIYGLLTEVRKVQIDVVSVKLIYFLWQRELPYQQITDIVLDNLPLRGGDRAEAVLIKLHKGKGIKLLYFKEGSLALFDALRAAWKDGNE